MKNSFITEEQQIELGRRILDRIEDIPQQKRYRLIKSQIEKAVNKQMEMICFRNQKPSVVSPEKKVKKKPEGPKLSKIVMLANEVKKFQKSKGFPMKCLMEDDPREMRHEDKVFFEAFKKRSL